MQWPDTDWPGNEPARHRVVVGDILELELSVPDRRPLERWTLGLDLRSTSGTARATSSR